MLNIKIGDKVKINPKFKLHIKMRGKWGDELEDAVKHNKDIIIEDIRDVGINRKFISVKLSAPSGIYFYLWQKTLSFWVHEENDEPLILLSGNSAVDGLKQKNTDPNAKTCYSCGAKLINPMPWIHNLKHCPKCEP